VRFRLELPPGASLVEESERYRPFLVPSGRPVLASVDVQLHLDPLPPSDGAPLYDTGETWIAFPAPEGVRIEFRHRRPDPRPLWTALVPERLAAGGVVHLHCSPELVASRGAGTLSLHNPLRYPLDQILTVRALLGEGVLIHAAGVCRAGRGVVLPGRSGAGKSTSMRLLRHSIAFERLSDDRVAVRRRDGRLVACGTPWAGDEGIAVAAEAELLALAFLHKAGREELRRLTPGEALKQLLATLSLLGWDGLVSQPVLGFCRALLAAVPAWEIHFQREGDLEPCLLELFQ
jgi:hypothetical protein